MNYVILAIAVLGIGFIVYWLQAPRAGTERLVMAVWAAFGPYSDAEFAEKTLQRIAKIVFGEQGISAHEQWVKAHGENFRDWEADGRFEWAHKAMCAGLRTNMYGRAYRETYAAVRQSFVEEAKKGAEWLNKEFLEQTGHRMEPVEQPDGSLHFHDKKIWSDEQIEQHERDVGNKMLDGIGENISNDKSTEAKLLLAFLHKVYEVNLAKPMSTPREIGTAWFACLKLTQEDPDSELAQTFNSLNDAWTATRQQQEQT